MTMIESQFKTRFKRDPIPELGEPCPHGGSPVDCEACTAVAIASLPVLQPTRCREHKVDSMRVVKAHCSHSATQGRFGQAFVCETCGFASHRWSGFVCGRRRATATEIEQERDRCPLNERLRDQKEQVVQA